MDNVRPTLCLDFDGVLHSYTSGWKGADVVADPPVEGAQEFVRAAQEHFRVVVYSSRSKSPGGIEAMRKWMADNSFPVVEFAAEKPAAFVTIDDRAITFTGEWPAVEELLAFKPWNRK
jgi:hypothetical protein